MCIKANCIEAYKCISHDYKVLIYKYLFFLQIFVGKAEDKLRIFFNMYDIDKSGHLSRDEFKTMLK